MPSSENGIVVFLDALGTKGSWKNKKASLTIRNWESLNDIFDKFLKKTMRQKIFAPYQDLCVQKDAFSDTMIITATPRNVRNSLELGRAMVFLCEILSIFMVKALDNNIFLRGSISVGRFYRSKRMIIGPAVDEAAEYFELPQWIGISAAPSAHLLLERLIRTGDYFGLVLTKYNIPLHSGLEQFGWALNWPESVFVDTNPKKTVDEYMKLRIKFEKLLMKTSSLDVAFKIRNTLDFINHSRVEHDLEESDATSKTNLPAK